MIYVHVVIHIFTMKSLTHVQVKNKQFSKVTFSLNINFDFIAYSCMCINYFIISFYLFVFLYISFICCEVFFKATHGICLAFIKP